MRWSSLPPTAKIAAARATYELAIEKKNEAQAYLDMLNGEALPEDVPGSSLTSLVEAQTALQTAQENLEATQLISPISGIVTDLTASVGDYVSASSIITVADLSQPYTIDAYFDAEDWSKVQAGYEAEIVFDILPDDTYTGTVTTGLSRTGYLLQFIACPCHHQTQGRSGYRPAKRHIRGSGRRKRQGGKCGTRAGGGTA